MKLIAAAAADWGLGFRGKLLFSIPEDMKFFREKTTDHVVVMGRKTLESFPGGRPLKNRVNVVLTTDPEYQAEGAVIVHSIEEARKVLSRYEDASVYVIGGEKIYRQMLPYCDEAFITRIDAVREADAFLPNLDRDPEWYLAATGETKEHEGLIFRFCTYKRFVQLPKDPMILYSLINTKLRDTGKGLRDLCDREGMNPEDVTSRLAIAGFVYDEETNQFR